jgi:DNA-directed RNA polymerase II subunit RPB1
MGVVQDALSGSFFLSRKNSMFTRDDMMQLMMQIEHSPIDLRNLPAPAVFKPVPMWTGKQVFSMIVPKNISLERDIRDLKANKLDKNKKEIDQSKYKWIEEIEDERLKQLTLDAVQDVVMDADERRVVIRNGELLSGTLCKQSLGATAGGLIHIMYRDCGP